LLNVFDIIFYVNIFLYKYIRKCVSKSKQRKVTENIDNAMSIKLNEIKMNINEVGNGFNIQTVAIFK